MAETRKRLVAVVGTNTLPQVGLKPPLSRRAVTAMMVMNAIVLIVSFNYIWHWAARSQNDALAVVVMMLPSILALVGVYVLWASDDLSVLRRQLRRAELVAKLKALS
jgi:hypothetical protein